MTIDSKIIHKKYSYELFCVRHKIIKAIKNRFNSQSIAFPERLQLSRF